MSQALERVIAEQQEEIDRLRTQLEQQSRYGKEEFEQKEDIFIRAARIADWWKLRNCWKDDKAAEWTEYASMRQGLLIEMRDYGFCVNCRSLTCAGECHDE